MVAKGSSAVSMNGLCDVLQTQPAHQHARQYAGVRCGVQRGDDGVGRGRQGGRVAGRKGLRCPGRQDRLVHDVTGEGHVDRPAVVQGLGDETLGLVHGVRRSDDRAGADDGVRHRAEQVELAVAQGVVHQRAIGLGGQGGHAGQVEDRQILGVGAGDRADRAEFADAVGGADGSRHRERGHIRRPRRRR